MRAFSANSAATVKNVRPRHILHLLTILHRATVTTQAFIVSQYSESATHFDEVFAFLSNIGWLYRAGGEIHIASAAVERIASAADHERSHVLVEELLEDAGPYKNPFARYLMGFRRSNNELVCRPDAETRLRDAPVRDFLMDLGAVTHRLGDDVYVLEQSFAGSLLWARNILALNGEELRRRQEERVAFATGAELAVIAWERVRVGRQWEGRVKHVSNINPGACFDIQSVSVRGQHARPRFIEVKAVSRDSFEFHWSRAELEAAEILAADYFLYLLPAPGRGTFDMRQMLVIPNAYTEVYRNPSKWLATVTDIVCRRSDCLDS